MKCFQFELPGYDSTSAPDRVVWVGTLDHVCLEYMRSLLAEAGLVTDTLEEFSPRLASRCRSFYADSDYKLPVQKDELLSRVRDAVDAEHFRQLKRNHWSDGPQTLVVVRAAELPVGSNSFSSDRLVAALIEERNRTRRKQQDTVQRNEHETPD